MTNKWYYRVALISLFLWFGHGNAQAIDVSGITSEINQARSAAGLKPLELDPALSRASQLKLVDLQTYKYWSHSNPASKLPWYHFLRESGVNGKVGENLGRGYEKSSSLVSSWLKSSTHRANILRKDFKHLGLAIGVVNYQSGSKTVVVGEFGQ